MKARIHGVAVDAGSGLAAAIRDARGADAAPDDPLTFKRAVLEVLGPDATTVLVDAHYGPRLLPAWPPGCAPMLAYEADVYHISDEDRITVLPEGLRIADYPGMGVPQLKFFMYYAPDDPPDLNARKEALMERIGAECAAHGIAYLLEPLVYHRDHAPGTPGFAAIKPDLVRRAVATLAQPRFRADILKIEVPVDLGHVAGFGTPARSRAEALDAFRAVAEAAGDVPCVYLSAGVPFEMFEASLALAGEAGVDFAGFMCGRAIWSDAVGIFGARGEAAMRDWLATTGRERLRRLIATL